MRGSNGIAARGAMPIREKWLWMGKKTQGIRSRQALFSPGIPAAAPEAMPRRRVCPHPGCPWDTRAPVRQKSCSPRGKQL